MQLIFPQSPYDIHFHEINWRKFSIVFYLTFLLLSVRVRVRVRVRERVREIESEEARPIKNIALKWELSIIYISIRGWPNYPFCWAMHSSSLFRFLNFLINVVFLFYLQFLGWRDPKIRQEFKRKLIASTDLFVAFVYYLHWAFWIFVYHTKFIAN